MLVLQTHALGFIHKAAQKQTQMSFPAAPYIVLLAAEGETLAKIQGFLK